MLLETKTVISPIVSSPSSTSKPVENIDESTTTKIEINPYAEKFIVKRRITSSAEEAIKKEILIPKVQKPKQESESFNPAPFYPPSSSENPNKSVNVLPKVQKLKNDTQSHIPIPTRRPLKQIPPKNLNETCFDMSNLNQPSDDLVQDFLESLCTLHYCAEKVTSLDPNYRSLRN